MQVVTGLLLVGLPAVALLPHPSPLLGPLFDLNYASTALTVTAMALVTLAAFTTSSTILATSWTTIVNAPARFGTPRVLSVSFPIHWPERLVFGLMAAPAVVGAMAYSWEASRVSRLELLLGSLIGLAIGLGFVRLVSHLEPSLRRSMTGPHPHVVARFFNAVLRRLGEKPNITEGYVDPSGALGPGHLQALLVFLFSFLLYATIGISKFVRLGYPAVIPTLGAVMLLLLLFCWAASGLAFFFDRYRVPVLVPLLILPVLTAWMPLSDHYYRTSPHGPGYSRTPGETLSEHTGPVIVVAVDGGGIQAAAWGARVLTGLSAAARAESGDRFERSIRLVSSVSGGSIGAMYFVNQYRDGGLQTGFEAAVDQAEASSLDDVAWGAAYPDLLRIVLPVFHVDRGQALEWAWTRDGGVAANLAQWRDDVYAWNRPGIIFNATIVDTGERLLVGSERIGSDRIPGLRNFEDLYPGTDVQVVTAARLSASFPYVTPAARADLPGAQYHVVDGGYYDNYGMTTLLQWLERGLSNAGPRPRRVLVIQIRSAPPESDPKPDGWHGWFYQAWAPLEAMLDVRTTGQLSHNEEDLRQLQEDWSRRGVEIDNAVFQFCGDHPPLSWHLTGHDKVAIAEDWMRELSTGGGWQVVRAFLAGQTVPAQPRFRTC